MEINSLTPNVPTEVSTAKEISSDFETFLKMLTTQVQNQDPLNPVDSSDYATQLATFSGVEQQVQTNDLLRALQGQFGATGIAQLADWVGKEARTSAPVALDGSPIVLHPSIAGGTETAVVAVRNSNDDTVAEFSIPTDGAPIEWAGVTSDGFPFPAGSYTFEVQSYSAGELIGSAPAETYGMVTEIRRTPDGSTVVVLGDATEVSADDVIALRAAA